MPGVAAKTKPIDPRVATAIAHWAPRFVSNGVLLADFEEVTAGIERWEDWCRAWCERGKVHETLGREALAQGYALTAGEHLVRAAMYYQIGRASCRERGERAGGAGVEKNREEDQRSSERRNQAR